MTWQSAPAGAPIVCGHRGAPVAAPENTLASFSAAIDRGATWVEFDIRPSADRQLVIHHDPETADGVHIGSTARADLDPSIPTLGELAQHQPNLGVDIEMKVSGIDIDVSEYVDLLIVEIDEHFSHRPEQVLVTSFSTAAIGTLKARRPDITTGLLFHRMTPEWAIDTAGEAGHSVLLPWYPLLSEQFVADARAAGFGMATWTVNDPAVVRRAVELGLDMVIGDDPSVIIENLS